MAKKILIGGEWSDAGESIDVRAPFTEELLATVASASPDEVERSIAEASEAARAMRKLTRLQTAEGLQKIASELSQRKEEFARTIAAEAAKPIKYARAEVERGIATFTFAAREASRFTGEVVPVDAQANGRGKTAFTMRIPRGVIFGITPFNFPLNLVAHKVAPALASGNSIIIKPSPRTPLTALLLGEVFVNSGLPASALQIVPADVKYVDRFLQDDRVAMISFTGSAEVGWGLKSRAGKKMVALELGGNAPVIVDEGADLDRSISRSATAAFAYSGQVCISVQRVYVHEAIYPEWMQRFADSAAAMPKGDPFKEDTELSVMIDEAAAERAEKWVDEAVAAGAKRVLGKPREGKMLGPQILTNADPEMRIVAEEAFAPVAVVEPFSSIEQAVEMANSSRYGLQAGVFSNDAAHIRYCAENLEYGGVTVNDAPNFRTDNMPYGGVKDSGFGREGVRYAMEEMTEIRLVVSEA